MPSASFRPVLKPAFSRDLFRTIDLSCRILRMTWLNHQLVWVAIAQSHLVTFQSSAITSTFRVKSQYIHWYTRDVKPVAMFNKLRYVGRADDSLTSLSFQNSSLYPVVSTRLGIWNISYTQGWRETKICDDVIAHLLRKVGTWWWFALMCKRQRSWMCLEE